MNKKFVVISLLALITHESIYSNDGFGAGMGIGLGTGALLGTSIALASRPRDPYYDIERAKAQQELNEIRAENRLRQEEERQLRRAKRQEEREEREHQRQLRQKEREEARAKTRKKSIFTKNTKSSHVKETQSPEELQLEIKKLEFEIAQLKTNLTKKQPQAAA